MDQLFQRTLSVLESAFQVLEEQVPKPIKKPFRDSFVFRYKEESIYQALILKLARVVSGLHAAKCLLDKGLLQEQGILQRMLDEFGEDILFLVYGLTNDKITDLHKEYLSCFYAEEFDVPESPIESSQKRGMVTRKKIRAYIARVEGSNLSPSDGVELSRTISKAYSGYVHGAAPHIMDMYCGYPPRFHISSMLGTPMIEVYRKDLWNYFYRGIFSFIVVAKAFGDSKLVESLDRFQDEFEKESRTNYGKSVRKPNNSMD
jgi:hypothetical protein